MVVWWGMVENVFYFNFNFKTVWLINILYFYMNVAENILLKPQLKKDYDL